MRMKHHLQHLQHRRNDETSGFTLLEIIVCLAVLGIIMVPLTAAFISSIQRTQEVQKKVGASADAERIAAWWTKDVHNVEANGVALGASYCPAPRGSVAPPIEQALLTFTWDTSTSAIDQDASGGPRVVPKSASWVIEGQGPSATLVRRYCENDEPISEAFIADSFYTFGYDAARLIHGPAGYGDPTFCTANDCTIEVSGSFNYKLTVERRVPGVTPASSSTPPPPTITGCVGANSTVTVAWLASVVPDGLPPVDQYRVAVASSVGGALVTTVTVNGAALSALISSLTNGSNYWIQVQAHNDNGWGLLSDAFGPCSPAPVAPGPPINVTAVREAVPPGPTAGGQIKVSWDAPADNGGTAITGWKIRTQIKATAEVIAITEIPGGGLRSGDVTLQLDGTTRLPNGTELVATVSAVNASGEGSESLPSDPPVIPCGVPSAPLAPQIAAAQDQKILVNYLEPDGNGCAVTKFRVYTTPAWTGANPGPWTTQEYNPADSNDTLRLDYTTPSLSASTYRVQVAAVNAVGEGPLSPLSLEASLSAVPTVAPDNVTWEPRWTAQAPPRFDDNLGGLARWTPLPNVFPFNGGFSITRYQVTLDPVEPGYPTQIVPVGGANSQQTDIGDMLQTIGTFPNAKYMEFDVSVAAVNDNGVGVGSTPIRVRAGGKPLASPDNPRTEPMGSNGNVRVLWDPVTADIPANNGGRPFDVGNDRYEVQWGTSPTTVGASASNRFRVDRNATHQDIGDLAPGTTYYFRVATINGSGASIPATTVSRVAPGPVTAPAGAVTVSRPAGSVGNRLALDIPAFVVNGGTPAPTYGARCTSPAETDAVFAGLTVGLNTLDSPALINGKPWTCTVTATVTYFTGNTSTATKVSSGSATPFTSPGAPGTPVVSSLTAGKVRITWTAPANNGGSSVTGYTISSSPALSGFPQALGAATLSYDTPVALTFGSTYTFTVTPDNAAGAGTSASSAPFSPSSSIPIAPSVPTWTPVYQNQLTFNWTPVPNTSPQNGGNTITSQTLTLSPVPTTLPGVCTAASGTATCTLSATASTFTFSTAQQQTAGTITDYAATIRATNGIGNGPTASVSNARAGGAPLAAVTGLSSRPYNAGGAITLDWTPVPNTLPSNGGRSINGYAFRWKSGAGAFTAPYLTGPGSSTNLGGFTPGVAYTFRVYANNEDPSTAGISALYTEIVVVAPGPPTPVAGTTVTRASNPTDFGSLIVNFPAWSVPTGGATITKYTALCKNMSTNVEVESGPLSVGVDNRLTGFANNVAHQCKIRAYSTYVAGDSTVDGPYSASAFPR